MYVCYVCIDGYLNRKGKRVVVVVVVVVMVGSLYMKQGKLKMKDLTVSLGSFASYLDFSTTSYSLPHKYSPSLSVSLPLS